MKKWISLILAFYVLFSAIVPCSILDDCAQETPTAQPSEPGHRKDCSDCSPFSVCSATPVYIFDTDILLAAPVELAKPVKHSGSYLFTQSAYCASLFQPPRAG